MEEKQPKDMLNMHRFMHIAVGCLKGSMHHSESHYGFVLGANLYGFNGVVCGGQAQSGCC
jgi:hypothetical protein